MTYWCNGILCSCESFLDNYTSWSQSAELCTKTVFTKSIWVGFLSEYNQEKEGQMVTLAKDHPLPFTVNTKKESFTANCLALIS